MNQPLLRVIDANANRAREALRVMEDCARFVLNSGQLSAELKQIRHALAAALDGVAAEAILHRDTAGDVGTANKTDREQSRQNITHVVTAAGKRLSEALRAIEEFAKIIDPAVAAQIEQLRYAGYETERKLAFALRRTHERLAAARLYVLISESACAGDWYVTAEQVIEGGAEILQLREKEMDGGELLCRAKRFVTLCRSRGVISIINDRADIALLSGADGVHVGQGDLPAVEARKLLGRDKIVGVSTHRIEHARQAVIDGADYIGVGPFFRSPTKPRDFIAGPTYAREVASEVLLPAFAIAGITHDNLHEVKATGMTRIAVMAAVTRAEDVPAAAKALQQRLAALSDVGQVPQPVTSGLPPALQKSETRAPAAIRGGGTDIPVCGGGKIAVPPKAAAQLHIRCRNLPHWELQGRTYFITFRLAPGIPALEAADRHLVREHIISCHGRFYTLFAMVVLPDHVHLLLRPNKDVELARIMKGTKGTTAHLVNQRRRSRGTLWQDESYDRIVRNAEEFDEKVRYMLENPVKAGLVGDPWQYDGWFCNTSEL